MRLQAGWNNWRRMSGVIFDRRLSACVKGKVYKTVVRPAMLYGLETVPLTKKQEVDAVREDMRVVGVSDRDTASRNWRLRIRYGDP